jgi:hypothetical protein
MKNRKEIEKLGVRVRGLMALGVVLLFLGFSVQNRFDWAMGIVISFVGVALVAVSLSNLERIKCKKCSKVLGPQVLRGGLSLRGKLRLNYCPFCGEQL